MPRSTGTTTHTTLTMVLVKVVTRLFFAVVVILAAACSPLGSSEVTLDSLPTDAVSTPASEAVPPVTTTRPDPIPTVAPSPTIDNATGADAKDEDVPTPAPTPADGDTRPQPTPTPDPPRPAPTPAPPAPTPTPAPTPEPPAPIPTPEPTPEPRPNVAPSFDDASVATANRRVTVTLIASDPDGDVLDVAIVWPDGATDTASAQSGEIVEFTHIFSADVFDGMVSVSVADPHDAGATGNLAFTAIAEQDVSVSDLVVTANASCFAVGLDGQEVNLELRGNGALLIDTNGYSEAAWNGGLMRSGRPGRTVDFIPMDFGHRQRTVLGGIATVARVELGSQVVVRLDATLGDIVIQFQRSFTRSGTLTETFVGSDPACTVEVTTTVTVGNPSSTQGPITVPPTSENPSDL